MYARVSPIHLLKAEITTYDNYLNSTYPGASECTTCEAGHYCDQNATTQAFMYSDRICPAGVECPPGMARQPDLVSDKCRVGHYCPSGDVSAYPVACPEGTYNPDTGEFKMFRKRIRFYNLPIYEWSGVQRIKRTHEVQVFRGWVASQLVFFGDNPEDALFGPNQISHDDNCSWARFQR